LKLTLLTYLTLGADPDICLLRKNKQRESCCLGWLDKDGSDHESDAWKKTPCCKQTCFIQTLRKIARLTGLGRSGTLHPGTSQTLALPNDIKRHFYAKAPIARQVSKTRNCAQAGAARCVKDDEAEKGGADEEDDEEEATTLPFATALAFPTSGARRRRSAKHGHRSRTVVNGTPSFW